LIYKPLIFAIISTTSQGACHLAGYDSDSKEKPMKITKANDRFLLVPGNNVEREAIAKVIELLNPGDRPNDVTTEIDKRNGRKCIKVFNIGGTKVEGDYDYVGGFNFRVRGTTLTDARYAGRIRDICFLGTGIYYVGPTLDKHSGIYLGGGPCVECGEPTVGPGAMSYSHPVCDKCAEHCPHDWKLGPGLRWFAESVTE
jgi:hypothetical protein